jgi:Alpha/beta hydrolase domain
MFRSAARFAWRRSGRGGIGGAVAVPLAAAVLVLPSIASADGRLTPPTATAVGDFGGLQYVQYDGIFAGQTSTGTYRVPYRVTAPAQPRSGNRTVLVEPPHFAIGLGALDLHLGRDFLLSRGFSHVGVGYSTTDFGDGANLRILDPSVPGVFINGGFADEGGRTDDEIIVDFARALSGDAQARSILGRVQRRYLTGFSDSSRPVLRIVTSGAASGVFDLAFLFTAEGMDPQSAVADGRYAGRSMILNSEFEGPSADYVDRGVARRRYRFYAEAGTPHFPDVLVPSPSTQTTPASYEPALRAHFVQADRWVQQGKQPPASSHLLAADGQKLDRDANGNAIAVDAHGRLVPRLPFVELGEARYITDFFGSYDQVKTIADLGFRTPTQYFKAFAKKLHDYIEADSILKQDADAMSRRAGLCPPLTFTQTYRDHYDEFVAIKPCGN